MNEWLRIKLHAKRDANAKSRENGAAAATWFAIAAEKKSTQDPVPPRAGRYIVRIWCEVIGVCCRRASRCARCHLWPFPMCIWEMASWWIWDTLNWRIYKVKDWLVYYASDVLGALSRWCDIMNLVVVVELRMSQTGRECGRWVDGNSENGNRNVQNESLIQLPSAAPPVAQLSLVCLSSSSSGNSSLLWVIPASGDVREIVLFFSSKKRKTSSPWRVFGWRNLFVLPPPRWTANW